MSMNEDDGAARIVRAQRIWRTWFYWGLAITFMQFVVSAYFALQLWPRVRVPLHWGLNGEVNRWGSGHEAAFVVLSLPLLSLLIMTIVRFVCTRGPHLQNLAATPRLLASVFVFVPLLLLAVSMLSGWTLLTGGAKNLSAWQARAIFAAAGALVAGLGNFLGKTQRNWWVGVRTPWSMSSDLAWGRSNRIAGRFMVVTGLATILVSAFGPPMAPAIVLIGGTILMATVSIYVSWDTWRRDPNRTV